MPHAQLSLPPSSDPTRRSWFWPAAIGVGFVVLALVLSGGDDDVEELADNYDDEGDEYEEDDDGEPEGEEPAEEDEPDDIEDAEVSEPEGAPVGRYAKARRRR